MRNYLTLLLTAMLFMVTGCHSGMTGKAIDTKTGKHIEDVQKAVKINSPKDASVVMFSWINVYVLHNDYNATVSVNGRDAEYSHDNWFVAKKIGLKYGLNKITATAIDSKGVTSTDSITVRHKAYSELLYVAFPFENVTISKASVNVEGIVSDPEAKVFVNGVAATVYTDGWFVASGVSLTTGDNTITVQATNQEGQTTTATAHVKYQPKQPEPQPIAVTIESPLNSSTTSKSEILVWGTFNSTADKIWVNVNGIAAEVQGNRFFVNDLPLKTVGDNRVIVNIEDSNGATGRAETTVHMAYSPYVTLRSYVTIGLPPLTVYFHARAEVKGHITKYQIDYDGDGVNDYECTDFFNIKHTYTAEGVYFPKLTATDSKGNKYTDTIAVAVVNRKGLEMQLKAKWEEMKTALLAGEIEKAVGYFIPGKTRSDYRKLFSEMGRDKINKTYSNIIDIRLDSFANYSAQCSVIRKEKGGMYSYSVQFMKDQDGVWRILQF
jgi:PKD repeat protein